MLEYVKKLITPDMVSFWLPSGQNRAMDIIRGNYGQCHGTHPNVPVISKPVGDDLVTNGGFDSDTTGWAAVTSGILTSETGGHVGNCLMVKNGAADWGVGVQSPAVEIGKTYKVVVRYKKGTAANGLINIGYLGAAYVYSGNFSATGGVAWTEYSWTFEALATDCRMQVFAGSAVNGETSYYDSISLYEVKPAVINPSLGWGFDGDDDFVDFGSKESLTFLDSEPWSFSHWVRWAGQVLDNVFYAGYSLGTESFLLRRAVNNRFAWRDKTGAYHVFAADSSSSYINVWTYLTWVADGSGNLSLYINTELLNTLTSVPTQLHFDNIGEAYVTSQYNFKGYIGLPFVANAAWSQQQVENFYNATRGMFAPRG